jgi:predicted RNA binding protein YcfA (HicA-like mRNA interferase family)
MAPRLRRLSARELCQELGRPWFQVVAVRGSHAKLRRIAPDGQQQTLSIPLHRELASGTLRAIFRQACRFVAEEELRRLFFHRP